MAHLKTGIDKNQDLLNSRASLIINLQTYWYLGHQLKKWHVSFNSFVECYLNSFKCLPFPNCSLAGRLTSQPLPGSNTGHQLLSEPLS